MSDMHRAKRVLVVDDDQDSREVLGELITYLGRSALLARDAREALAVVLEQAPEIGLIDVSLPDIDGCELARRLRKLVGSRMHLIALTGHSDAAVRQRAAAAGFDDYWVKPIDYAAIGGLLGTAPAHDPR
jgi:CheY-like chemotaxis protein